MPNGLGVLCVHFDLVYLGGVEDEMTNGKGCRNRSLSRAYREGYDRIFGKGKKKEEKSLADHCREASKIVEAWPEWKKNVLGDSSKPQRGTTGYRKTSRLQMIGRWHDTRLY